MVTFVKSISSVLAPYNITANTVLPGYTTAERVKFLIKRAAAKRGTTLREAAEDIIKNIPAGRIGLVEEFASVVAFLTSDEASYITGVSIPIDGGFTKRSDTTEKNKGRTKKEEETHTLIFCDILMCEGVIFILPNCNIQIKCERNMKKICPRLPGAN